MNETSIAAKRRTARIGGRISGALIIVASLVSLIFKHAIPAGSPASILLALLPFPFLIVGVGFAVWSARMCDELHRKIQFEALAFAYPAAFVLVFLALSLQGAGYWRGVGTAEVMMALCVLYPVGLLFAWNRYR
jgi:hypothetical protein